MTGIHGWIILDKPVGLGSTQAVSAVKRVLREGGVKVSGKGPGKTKVGHGGTLDPLASGVLPIAVGEATKLTGRMLDASKIYEFTIFFGTQTAGLDAEGDIVATSEYRPTLAEIEAVLSQFTGPIEQVPPAFSAIKVDGRRAYDRARAGEDVEMKAREVEVYSLAIRETRRPSEGRGLSQPEDQLEHGDGIDASLRWHDEGKINNDKLNAITLTAHVSKGTYIRSLARDIALAANTVGHVTMLRRTRAGPFGLKEAISLDKLNECGKGAPLRNIILPLEAGLADIPVLNLSPETAEAIRQGRVPTGISVDDGSYFARDAEMRPVALVEATAGMLKVMRGFNI